MRPLSFLAVVLPLALAAPQRDRTFTLTCLGPTCTYYPPTVVTIPTTMPGGQPIPRTMTTITSSSLVRTTRTPNPPPSSSSRVPPRPSSTSPARQTSSPAKTTAPAPSKTTGVINGPSHWACPVPLYYQCGGYFDGKPWTGCTKCASGATCLVQNGEFTLSVARIAIWGSAELEGK